MANRNELNVFDENLHRDRRKFAHCKMESRVFLPSYRYRHSISFPCRPKPRRPLASYIHRLTLQYEPNNNRQIFSKIHDSSGICIQSVRPKYESFITQRVFEEEFLKKSSVAERGSRKNCWLSQIKQVRKEFSCLLPISSLSRAIAGVIVGIIIGITFYI